MTLNIESLSARQKSDTGPFFCSMRSVWTMRYCHGFWREATSYDDNRHERSWV